MLWFLLGIAAVSPSAAKNLTFAWPAGTALDVTETLASTTTNMGEAGPESTHSAGTLRIRLLPDPDGARVRYASLKEGVERTVLDLVVASDGTRATADTSVLSALATESIATSTAKDPALGAFMKESLRRDLARAASDMVETWMRNVGLWVGHPAVKGTTKAVTWGRSVATIQGLATIVIQGTAVSQGRVPCSANEPGKHCVRLVATGQAEPSDLAAIVAASPEVLRYLVGPVPPGRGNAAADEVQATLSEVITMVTRPKSLLPISVETTLSVGVTLERAADPVYRRTVVTTSRLDFAELSLFTEADPS